MKKGLFVSAAFFIVAATQAGNVVNETVPAKNSSLSGTGIKGKYLIGMGPGFNLMGAAIRLQYSNSTYWKDHDLSGLSGTSAPMFNVSADYGITERFSAGIAFGYQVLRLQVHDSTESSGIIYTDLWKRVHIAARGDYYIVAKNKISVYTGLKIGYNVYSMSSTRTIFYPTYQQELNVHPSSLSLQAHIGMSCYFNSIVGANAEVGLGVGGPYLLALGVALKI